MKISDNCYLISGLSGPGHWVPIAGFITGNHKTLVIDTGMTYMSGRTIHGYALAAKPDNEILAAVTEPHFDHIGGNCFFKEQGIEIFGHKDIQRPNELIEAAKVELNTVIDNSCRKKAGEEDAYFLFTEVVNPDRDLSHGDVFDLGGIHVEVLATPGHTPANLSFLAVEEKVLFCGDAVVTHYIPNLEAGEVKDWKTWLDTLDLIEEKKPDIIVPGHGDLIKGKNMAEDIQRIRGFLKTAIVTGKPPTL